MRVELDIAEAGGGPWGETLPRFVAPQRRRRLDPFELATLGTFAVLSLWVLGLDLWQVIVHGQAWTGTDGVYVVDQMQYLAWIKDASRHFLGSNMFVAHSTPADYFHPALVVSAGLTALGVAPWVSLLLWKPVAVLCAFFAVHAFAGATLPDRWPRRAALLLALFFGSFSVVGGDFSVVGDLFLGFLSWGYTFGLLAVALLVFALLAYDRARRTGRRVWLPALLGATAGLLHPWQAELLIVIVLGAELAMWRATGRRPRVGRLPLTTLVVTAIPLLYYAILGQADPYWSLARQNMKHSFSIGTIALALAPLLVPALFAYRGRTRSFMSAIMRTWPVAAVAIWGLSATHVGATPLHAFDGIAIPLSVLAVEGAQRLGFGRLPRPRLIGALAIALVTIPATAWLMHFAATLVAPTPGNPNFVLADEQRALRYLASDPRPGAVLTRFYLGTVVPAETGRRTYVGNCLWSQPGCISRAYLVQQLFIGGIDPAASRSLVRSTGARYVLADCSASPALNVALTPMTASVTRFGCASVYELDPT
jgi:hypothetical protein